MTARWIVLAMLLASPLLAQEQTPFVEPGTRVRLHLVNIDRPVTGVFRGFNEDGLIRIDPVDQADPKFLSVPSVEKIEVRGPKRHTVRGLVIGSVLGGAVGAVAGLAVAGGTKVLPCAVAGTVATAYDNPPPDCPDGNTEVLIGAMVGAAVGGAIGGLIGSKPGEGWIPGELPPVKPLVAVHPTGRLGVGFAIPVGW